MGNMCSRADVGETQHAKKRFEATLAAAFQVKAKKTNVKSFEQIILKFPYLNGGFKKCMSFFYALDENGDGVIDVNELAGQISTLGVLETDSEALLDIFRAADIDDSKEIDQKEFVTLLAIFHLLKGDEMAFHMDKDIRNAFEMIEDLFCFFDANGNGFIEREEVKSAVGSSESGRMLLVQFKKLDWDRNGQISYPEFLFGLTKWVRESGDSDSEES